MDKGERMVERVMGYGPCSCIKNGGDDRRNIFRGAT